MSDAREEARVLARRAMGADVDDEPDDAGVDDDRSSTDPPTDDESGADDDRSSTDSSSTDDDSGLRDALMATEPSPSLDDVESPWQPDDGGLTRMYRAARKAMGVDGMPAVVDLAIGAAEAVVVRLRDRDAGVDDDDDDRSSTDGESDDDAHVDTEAAVA